MALGAGSIAFVGFNADGNDNIAFVALTGIPAGETIVFEDNEWNGTAFVDTNEGAFSWTASANVVAGSIVKIDNIGTGTISANAGTASSSVAGRGGNRGIGASGETIYAYQGSASAPVFLTAVTNGGYNASNGVLTGTGLTVGVNALDLSTLDADADIAAFTGARSGAATFADYRASINTASNWIAEDGTGDQGTNGTAPDVPFSSTTFTITGGASAIAIASLTVDAGSKSEGETFQFTVTLSGAVATDTIVSLQASGATADLVSVPTTVTIPAGQSTASFTIGSVEDAVAEADEP
jgi:hypothetical protein